jgi:hypothetical protein
VRKPAALPPALGSVFAVREALALGVNRDRLERSDLIAPFPGVRIVRSAVEPEVATLLQVCSAWQAIAPAVFAFSHVTAARIYGIPLPSRLERRVALDVAVPAGEVQPRGRGIIGHRLRALEYRDLSGLPVVPPEQAWMSLAGVLSIDELVVAGDFLVRRKRPLSTLPLLREAVARMARMRGASRLRQAVQEVRPGTDSPPESRVRLVIVRSGLPEPTVGHTVIDTDGYFVGTPDLAYIPERIAIEYEGDGHRTDARVFRDDIARRELFEIAGWRVLRVTSDDLRDTVHLVERVRRLLAQRRFS